MEPIDAALVSRLIAAQFPQWAHFRFGLWRSAATTTAPFIWATN